MKFAALFALATLTATQAFADQGAHVRKMLGGSAPAVPTGYQVPGKTFYILNGATVVQLDCDRAKTHIDVKLSQACGRGPYGGETPESPAGEAQ